MAYLRKIKKKDLPDHQPYSIKQKKKRQRPNRKREKLAKWGQSEMQRMIAPISHGFKNAQVQRHMRQVTPKLKGTATPDKHGQTKFIPPKRSW